MQIESKVWYCQKLLKSLIYHIVYIKSKEVIVSTKVVPLEFLENFEKSNFFEFLFDIILKFDKI